MNAKRFKLYAANRRIYVILRGGLGNQLHQIAAGVAIAENTNAKVRIFSHIVDSANDETRRGYFRSLNISKIFFSVDTRETTLLETLIIRVLNRISPGVFDKFVVSDENFFTFDKDLPFYMMKGWFQSHAFLPVNFSPKDIFNEANLVANTASIHVRLTDFSSIDRSPLDSEYYRLAIAKVNSLKSNLNFECFSDDIEEATKMLGYSETFSFPELNMSFRPDVLLREMSKNKYLISSRSSLSWWAAQVVSANGGIVISPWQHDVTRDSWISIL